MSSCLGLLIIWIPTGNPVLEKPTGREIIGHEVSVSAKVIANQSIYVLHGTPFISDTNGSSKGKGETEVAGQIKKSWVLKNWFKKKFYVSNG